MKLLFSYLLHIFRRNLLKSSCKKLKTYQVEKKDYVSLFLKTTNKNKRFKRRVCFFLLTYLMPLIMTLSELKAAMFSFQRYWRSKSCKSESIRTFILLISTNEFFKRIFELSCPFVFSINSFYTKLYIKIDLLR